jgi:hypothetical protein
MTAALSPVLLWPPNHRMVPVSASVTANDTCGAASITLASVTSTEADDAAGSGDGSTVNDVQGADLGGPDFDLDLRAERAGAGGGRVYSVVYRATDSSGNAAETTSMAVVPHDQSGITEPLNLTVREGSAGTHIDWSPVSGALYYNVIRGRLSELAETASTIELGDVRCIESASLDSSTSGREDSEPLQPGEGYFYLVEYNDGWKSSYGEPSTTKPRVVRSGWCQ